MGAVFTILLIFLIITGLPSYLVSKFTHKKLVKSENKHAKLFSIITFIVTFLLITGGICTIALYNIELER